MLNLVLLSFLVQFEDALQYLKHQRPMEPAVYYRCRLNELPIPRLQPNVEENILVETGTGTDDSSNNQDIENFNENGHNTLAEINENAGVNDENLVVNDSFVGEGNENPNCSDSRAEIADINNAQGNIARSLAQSGPINNFYDDLSVEVSSGANPNIEEILGTNGAHSAHNVSLDSESNDDDSDNVKPGLVPYIEKHVENNDAINELLQNAIETTIDDDLTIVIGQSGIPKPIPTTLKGLVKRQNDIVSNNIAYNETVRYL